MFSHLSRNQKFILQIVFWVVYYIVFGFIWVKDGDYRASFHLEFILLPMRILAVYVTILYLIPTFLLKKKFLRFLLFYLGCIFLLGLLQQFAIHIFYPTENLSTVHTGFSISTLIRATILINTTVFFVSTIYILHLYFKEREIDKPVAEKQMTKTTEPTITLKSNRKNYVVSPNTITHIESMGNYVIYHFDDGKKLTVYQSLKSCLGMLPDYFVRVHKSYVINVRQILAYNKDFVEVTNGHDIPIGAKYEVNLSESKHTF